jgi:hypothetical protein
MADSKSSSILPGAPALSNFVRIAFSSAPPLPSFPPIPGAMNVAHLDGSIHTQGPDAAFGTADDPPLPVLGPVPAIPGGVRLEAQTDAGMFGFLGPHNAPGAFAEGSVGGDPAPPVTALNGILTFAFDPAVHMAGDFVRLPASAVVRAEVPEPTTLAMFAVGLVGLGVVARCRRPWR